MPISELIVFLIILGTVGFIYISEFVLFSLCAYNKLRNRKRRIIFTRRATIIHIFAVLGIICFCYGHFIEPYRLEVNNISIQTNKLQNTSFRIAQITDIHCDKRPDNEKRIIQIINSLKPDIIVFTGDAINEPSYLPKFKETMKNLHAPLGKFAVYGNWEIGRWQELDYYSQTGFELLHSKTVSIEKNNESITISGLRFDKGRYANDTLDYLPDDTYNVFLFHYPDFVKYIDDYNIDLYLCGHTHGGQVALPYYGALITMSKLGKKYESGQYQVGKTTLYVNRGLGMDPYPPRIRLFSRPEIAVFDISPK